MAAKLRLVGHEGFELRIKLAVECFILVPQVLLLLSHCSLPLIDGECAHGKVLLLLDGSISPGFAAAYRSLALASSF
jgi:hypothetical protein